MICAVHQRPRLGWHCKITFAQANAMPQTALYPQFDGLSGLTTTNGRDVETAPRNCAPKVCSPNHHNLHRTIQSVGATGGVHKGQGRNQRRFDDLSLLGISCSRLIIALIAKRRTTSHNAATLLVAGRNLNNRGLQQSGQSPRPVTNRRSKDPV